VYRCILSIASSILNTPGELFMTKFRAILVVIIVPAAISLLVTLLVLKFLDARQAPAPQTIILPTHSSTAMIPPRATQPPVSTQIVGDTSTQAPAQTEPPTGCENPAHLVASGETLGVIATQYNVSIDDLIILNQMVDPAFDPDFLSVGQQLTIPVCGIPTPTPTGVPTVTPVPTRNVPEPIPTTTELPSGSVNVQIGRVLHPGDVTREAVEIVNKGAPVDLQGWTLSNDRGIEFDFPSFRLFTEGGVTIFTGAGENTPIILYWGRTNSAWRVGDTISLYDADGELQDEFEVDE
jgi:LysM repeat protein